MRIASPHNRLFVAFGNWVIKRSMRTPYFHLHHDDGRPYMERFWLLRLGMPKGWQQLERDIADMEAMARYCDDLGMVADAAGRWANVRDWRAALVPWFGIRVHHIQSSDIPVFHDHPWSFLTLILRGGYKESRPLTQEGNCFTSKWHTAGELRRVPAHQWHYLSFMDNPVIKGDRDDAWTLFFTFRKKQTWGFLVNGIKVPWRKHLANRRGK